MTNKVSVKTSFFSPVSPQKKNTIVSFSKQRDRKQQNNESKINEHKICDKQKIDLVVLHILSSTASLANKNKFLFFLKNLLYIFSYIMSLSRLCHVSPLWLCICVFYCA